MIFENVGTKWRRFFEKYKKAKDPITHADENGTNLLIAYFIYAEAVDPQIVKHIITRKNFNINHLDND